MITISAVKPFARTLTYNVILFINISTMLGKAKVIRQLGEYQEYQYF